jgi:hypothetical protein
LSSASRARALSTSKMPPQQSDRLLDLGDDSFDFGAHGFRDQVSGMSDQTRRIWDFGSGKQITRFPPRS